MPKEFSAARLPLKEKYSFSTALMGQTMIYNFVNLYLLIFYTDVLGISAVAAGSIFLGARIWDAVNDPIMGVIVDHTKTKWGKCRPYLLFFPLPIAFLTVLLFNAPQWSEAAKVAYAAVTYILWGMFYTSVDIPLWTMSSRMTTDLHERESLIASGRIFNIIGSALPVILVVPLKMALGKGDESRGYLLTVVLFCAVALPLLLQSFFITNERAPSSDEFKPDLKENLKAIWGNKPLLLLLSSSILNVLVVLPVNAGIFFVTYNLGDEALFAVMAGTVLVAAGLGSGLAPVLARRFRPRDILIWSSVLTAVLFTIGYFVGYGNFPVVIGFTFVIGTLLGVPLVLRTSMLAETIEHYEGISGKRSEGIIFSSMTFSGKLKMGIAAFLVGWILKIAGYVPEAVQSPEALKGIFIMLTIVPALGSLLTIIPLWFYRLENGSES
ncbi:MFS transporter [Spirochaeta isovalerica]|uniref:GPH family glycoside/pentoside/hexuronide:cation symporter/probable glucitol transport protein GutA n=1 Tax=Spirochaeta isovalerica TaxID=150 RepID=A0A841R8N9_9SPIO|nr:MFS transporter [Spirochaeta isovalerica]MBB6479400.1 GPH family glycoside/pentoside/hexuronide:cation symporter/probable glucitol transport protein GutA [Spirochaeta isovalerica]